MQNLAQFLTTLDFDHKYLEWIKISKIGKASQQLQPFQRWKKTKFGEIWSTNNKV